MGLKIGFGLSSRIEVFYLNSTLNFGILPVLVFQLEVCHKVDRLLTGITAQQNGTTARWYSNKTSLVIIKIVICHYYTLLHSNPCSVILKSLLIFKTTRDGRV